MHRAGAADATGSETLRGGAGGILAVLLLQIGIGGLVAGLEAGLVYDTWSLIDGAFIPAREKLMFIEPAWMNTSSTII